MPSRIERLTAKQEAQLSVVRDEWLRIGLATGPVDRVAAVDAFKRVYREGGLEPPRLILWMGSPLSGALACGVLKHQGDLVRDQVIAQVSDQVSDQVLAQVSDKVRAQVRAQVSDQVRDQVRDQVLAQVLAQVSTQVLGQVLDQVLDLVSDQVLAQVRDQVIAQAQVRDKVRDQARELMTGYSWWYAWGQFDAWLSYYAYFKRALGLTCIDRLIPLFEVAENCGWVFPFRTVAVLCERPLEIHRNGRGQLHRDGGPAVLYGDGFGVWALNGVRMRREIVEVPAAELKAELVLQERNGEKRRELVRKIGIDRVCSDLRAKVVDTWEAYQLLMLDLGDGRQRPYLRMRNPSIDATHVEEVHPDCRTVAEALKWRNGGINERPSILT